MIDIIYILITQRLQKEYNDEQVVVPGCCGMCSFGCGVRGRVRFQGEGVGERGKVVGVIREVEEPSHGVDESRGEAKEVQRVQGQCSVCPQLQQEGGQALQAEAEQVCRHDYP